MRTPSVCLEHGCPERAVTRGRCTWHHRQYVRAKQPSPSSRNRVRGKLRAQILTPGARCHWCGKPATTVDHVHPVALGGTSHPDNLAPACATCNSSHGATVRTTPT